MLRNTNTKTKSKNSNTRLNWRRLKRDYYNGCTSLKTQIARSWTVFGLITIFSLSSSAQCKVRDLSVEDQKKILTKFSLLDRCDSLQIVDSLEISALIAYKIELQEDNSLAIQSIEVLQLDALKQKKWPWIAGAVGVVIGFFIKSGIN